jgi:chemotaxis protein methyltransferase CheR
MGTPSAMTVADDGEDASLQAVEVRLLLEGIFQRYGFDFREYAYASIKRRILGRLVPEGLKSISGLQEKVLHDGPAMERLLAALTVHVTSMFRDPSFYLAFRQRIVPVLRTYPFVRIWHCGCSTGEEVYSMAILLHEEGLYERCRIYATDVSELVLAAAKSAIFPLSQMREYTENYQRAGGTASFSEYYTAQQDHVIFRPSLQQNVVFAQHNLVTDSSFNEFNVVLCRNVMIYFNKTLQERVHKLLLGSVDRFGVLALGRKESLHYTPHESAYEALDENERLYRKVRG